MKQNMKLGGILAVIGALMGIIGHYVLFINWYEREMAAEAAEPGCEILLKWLHPAVTDMGLLAGMAIVFCFMNGIASTSRIITISAPMFTMVQRLHWLAMIGWGVVTVGIILRPRAGPGIARLDRRHLGFGGVVLDPDPYADLQHALLR